MKCWFCCAPIHLDSLTFLMFSDGGELRLSPPKNTPNFCWFLHLQITVHNKMTSTLKVTNLNSLKAWRLHYGWRENAQSVKTGKSLLLRDWAQWVMESARWLNSGSKSTEGKYNDIQQMIFVASVSAHTAAADWRLSNSLRG